MNGIIQIIAAQSRVREIGLKERAPAEKEAVKENNFT